MCCRLSAPAVGHARTPRRRGTWCAASCPRRQLGTLPAGRADRWACCQVDVSSVGHVVSWACRNWMCRQLGTSPIHPPLSEVWPAFEGLKLRKVEGGRVGQAIEARCREAQDPCVSQSPTVLPARPSLRMTSPKCLPAEMTWSAASSRCPWGTSCTLSQAWLPWPRLPAVSRGRLCTRSRKMRDGNGCALERAAEVRRAQGREALASEQVSRLCPEKAGLTPTFGPLPLGRRRRRGRPQARRLPRGLNLRPPCSLVFKASFETTRIL